MKIYKIVIAIALICFFMHCSNQPKADLVVKNAIIWTGDSLSTIQEAMVVGKDRILFIGKNAEIEAFIDDKTEVIDAKGQFITPGFIDSHVHMSEGGETLATIQLKGITDKKVFIQKIAEFVKKTPKGQWITGAIFDNTTWGGEMPEAIWLDSVSKDNPLVIVRQDGHMILANSLAMKLANVKPTIKDVVGGVVVRDEMGKPTGIFKDNAQNVIFNAIPKATEAVKDNAILLAMDYLVSNGVTSVHNMSWKWDDFDTFKRVQKAGKSKVRIYSNMPLNSYKRLSEEIKKNGKGDNYLKIGGLKGFVDGSLGSHTAFMLEPYSDTKADKGILITPLDSLYIFTSNADKLGLQIMVHAIGDNAIRKQLDIYERVIKENGEKDRRFRIEHVQHIHPQDINRISKMKIIASMQPYHAIDDGRWADKYLGNERRKTTYAFKSLIDAGTILAFGSDWFVAPASPLFGIYAGVTRRTLDDKNPNGWVPEQKISVEDALKAYTINAAYASFDEKEKGSLEVGKLADFVIMDQDIRKIAPEKIKDTKVKMTIVGGKVVYKN